MCVNITVASKFFSSLTNVRCLWLILVFPTKKIVLVFKCYAWSVSYWSPVCLINNNIIFTFKQVFVRFPEYLGFLVYVFNPFAKCCIFNCSWNFHIRGLKIRLGVWFWCNAKIGLLVVLNTNIIYSFCGPYMLYKPYNH